LRKKDLLLPRIPVSTYRLQFNGNFTFRDAQAIVPYLHELGITDIYASPYFRAKAGSLHGYDIVDHNSLNPELGTDAEYNAWVSEYLRYGMGQLLDIVPNHMCVDSWANDWWMDVLENGPSSRFAGFFDIDWNPIKDEIKNKILLPVLGDQYGRVLENKELRLTFEKGSFLICYYDNKFPLRPETYLPVLRHRKEGLKKSLSLNDPAYGELLSILTSLEHLPSYTGVSPAKIRERYREKEIVKKRLGKLYLNSPEIRAFIDKNVRIYNGRKGKPRSFDHLDALLRNQAYRLSFWRVATEEINYRRFFDINSLAAIRVENPLVFESAHGMVLRLIRDGRVTGLRVDHPDGLYNSSEYFHRLQRNCYLQLRLHYSRAVKKEMHLKIDSSKLRESILHQYDEYLAVHPDFKGFYIVGEKILVKGERMPEEWPIFSTTGYVFLNSSSGIFVDMQHARKFDDIYRRFVGQKMDFHDVVYESKKLIMKVAMSSEINALGYHLNRISEKNRHTRDFTLNSLTNVIVEVIAFFPVYRTYTNTLHVSDKDRHYIEHAVSKAKRKNPAISASIFDFLRDVLLLNFPENVHEDEQKERLDFVMKFQQTTGPVMAKGHEDTACYVYNRLVSMNEVGGSPDRFGLSLEAFHGQNIERMKSWPYALIATTTHDTKRSEDVRARISVLSEIPDEWRKHLVQWSRLNKGKKVRIESQRVPDRNEEYLLYQTLIGAWPLGTLDPSDYEHFRDRIRSYMLKAVREAKRNTSWINPNIIYEDALLFFIERVMDGKGNRQFLDDFTGFQKKVSHWGLFNSLSQTLLKITCPGVPDFYQGTEVWNLSLVDPDNRQPVDYGYRQTLLQEIKTLEKKEPAHVRARKLTEQKDDGMIKLYLIYKALNFRKKHRVVFEKGEYLPLEVLGEHADCVCAFARRSGSMRIVVAVPRFFTRLVSHPGELPLGASVWDDSCIAVPYAKPGTQYRNIFTEERISAQNRNDTLTLALAEIFSDFPVAILEKIS
jgi:(1->4)-alpha-D-glucan 1-alpha-D-glucosylmutase